MGCSDRRSMLSRSLKTSCLQRPWQQEEGARRDLLRHCYSDSWNARVLKSQTGSASGTNRLLAVCKNGEKSNNRRFEPLALDGAPCDGRRGESLPASAQFNIEPMIGRESIAAARGCSGCTRQKGGWRSCGESWDVMVINQSSIHSGFRKLGHTLSSSLLV
jgi:hypothetical protein